MRVRTMVVTALLVVALSACGGDEDVTVGDGAPATSTTEPTTETDGSTDHNDADVRFAQMMIPHHEEAIEMAQLAAERAGSPEVLDLAARIEAAQGPEIELMRGWLIVWGEDDGQGGEMDMGDGGSDMETDSGSSETTMHAGMSDMMSELEAAADPEFDRRFLELMIEHHRSALEMAEEEVADGSYEPALELAQQIITDQQAEIDEMQAMLDEAGG